jgi:hypothetical protein
MFAAVAAAALFCSAAGTLIVPQSVEQLTQTSDLVVRGTVSGQESRWSPDHRLIFTFVRLRVEEAIKGSATGEIVVRRSGGQVDGIGQRVFGTPEFTDGEHVIVFLLHLPVQTPIYVIQGMAQGKLTLQTDAAGKVVAVQDNRDVSFSQAGQISPGGMISLSLEELLSRIRQAAGKH